MKIKSLFKTFLSFQISFFCFASLLILVFSVDAVSQDTQLKKCLSIISGEHALAGTPQPLSAYLEDACNQAQTFFNWSVSAGRIIEGQGTANILIDTTNLDCMDVTVNLIVSDIPSEYENKASVTLRVEKPKIRGITPLKICDDYATTKYLRICLDVLIDLLQKDADVTTIAVFCGGKKSPKTQIKEMKDITNAYLKKHNIDLRRLKILECDGKDTAYYAFYLIPKNAPELDCPPKTN